MQNLRDKLLKAGLVTEGQVKNAEKRQAPKPGPRPTTANTPPTPATLAERQAQEAFRARDAEVSEERRKDLAKHAEAKAQSERARSLRALVEQHRLREPIGEAQFHFVRRSGKIGRLLVSPATAKLLEDGAAAVVENPGQPDPAVLPADVAKQAYRIDPRAIFFWNGPQKPIGFEDAEGIDAPPEAPATE